MSSLIEIILISYNPDLLDITASYSLPDQTYPTFLNTNNNTSFLKDFLIKQEEISKWKAKSLERFRHIDLEKEKIYNI